MLSIFVISFLNGIFFGIYCCFVSCIILQKKEINIKKIMLSSLPFFIIHYCIFCLLDSIYAMFFSGLCAFFLIRMIFNENIFMSLFLSYIIHTVKVINKILILVFLNNENLLLINTYKTLDWNAFYIDLLVFVISAIIIYGLRKKLRKIVQYVSHLKNRKQILLFAIYLNFILIIVYQPPNNLFSLRTITDFIMIFTTTWLGIFNISSEMKMEALMNHYQEIFEYSKANGELLSQYKMQVHENKNRLLMIKGMLGESKDDVEKYLDSLLIEINDNKCNSNYWLTELRYIPFVGIRNFINYKLIKLRNLGAEIEVFISSELEKINPTSLNEKDYNQLSTILGVILDNMIESVMETEEKLISINLYIEGNKIHGEFVNSFSGKIDLNRLTEIGYTTKGEQHGIGLSVVAKITKNNERFECYPKIIDNFFVQHFTVKILNKTNLQKNKKN